MIMLDVFLGVANKVIEGLWNITFPLVLLVIYFIYGRNREATYYHLKSFRTSSLRRIVSATMQGFIAGIVGSLLMAGLGLPLTLTPYFLLLLPIAILLSLFNTRYLCFSYSAALLGLINMGILGLNYFGAGISELGLNGSGLLALVGVLHLMEAFLIFIDRSDDAIPIPIKQGKRVGVAFIVRRIWPLPFAMLIMSSMLSPQVNQAISMPSWWPLLEANYFAEAFMYGLLPITAIIGYNNVAIGTTLMQRRRKTSYSLVLYSIFLISLAILSINSIILQVIGLIAMPVLHEFIILMDQVQEMTQLPAIQAPLKGLKIIQVKKRSPSWYLGLKVEDILLEVDGTILKQSRDLQSVFRGSHGRRVTIKVEKKHGKIKDYEWTVSGGLSKFGVACLSKRPMVTYETVELLDTRSFLNKLRTKERKEEHRC